MKNKLVNQTKHKHFSQVLPTQGKKKGESEPTVLTFGLWKIQFQLAPFLQPLQPVPWKMRLEMMN